jgi:hypothetical protein
MSYRLRIKSGSSIVVVNAEPDEEPDTVRFIYLPNEKGNSQWTFLLEEIRPLKDPVVG